MKRKFWVWALLFVALALGLLIGGGKYYLNRMREILWTQSVTNTLEVTTQGGNAFESYLDQGLFMMEGRANNFARYDSSDEAAIGVKLDLYEDGDPSFVVMDLTHKTMYFNSRSKADISDDDLAAYLQLPEKGFLEPYYNEYTGQRMVGYYERFTFSDGAEGMVRKGEPLSEVAARFSLSFYDGAGSSYVVNANGDILFRTGGAGGNVSFLNIFDIAALSDNTEEDIADFRAHMRGGKKGVELLMLNDSQHVFAFVPLTTTDGWYLVTIVPNEVIMEYATQTLNATQVFSVVVASILLVLAAVGVVVVLYQRRLRDQELENRYQEQMFNLLANNTNDVFVMLPAEGDQAVYISPNIQRVMGVTKEAAMEDITRLQSVLHEDDSNFDISMIRETPLGDSRTWEGKCIHKTTGEVRRFSETVYHTTIESLERYIVVLADRTDDWRKEAALEDALRVAEVANRSKSTFLSNMSHDIRTPMNAIVGLSTLLQRDAEDPDKVREHTRKITASSQHLLSLINDVLDMSKIESGKTTLNVGEFGLAELVDGIAVIMRPQARSKNQEFDVVAQDLRNELLLGDKLRINQILINLLSNAVKYTQEGGRITLKVSQLGEATNGISHIRFAVADNGIGMSEEYQQQIFQPFTRESREVVNQIQGTGLGMAITKNLIDLMGGTISVESKEGEGSTFTVDLNLRIVEQEDDKNFWLDHGIGNTLIVDDDVDICSGILSAMAGTGVAMQFALDGHTAVSMTELAHQNGHDFDLILLDWKMPEMDGLETARQIRARVPAHIPIMILTAYDYDDVRDEALSVGIDGFLTKPFFLTSFKEAVKTLRPTGGTAPRPEGKAMADLSGKHFLCAEDNTLNAEILTELLDMEGATCEIMPNGKETVERFDAMPAGTYDAILMDVQMPVMNGYEATRAIRAMARPDAARIPIVAMTANAFADDIQHALDSGMNAHIAKPLNMEALLAALNRIQNEQEGNS